MKLLPPRRVHEFERAAALPSRALLERVDALLLLVPANAVERLAALPFGAELVREHARLGGAPGACWSQTLPTRRGVRVAVGVLPALAEAYAELALAARVVREVSAARPARIAIAGIEGPGRGATLAPRARESLLAALLAATESRPHAKRRPAPAWQPARIVVCGHSAAVATATVEDGAHLARWLTALPASVLQPRSYRGAIATLARRHRWRVRVYGESALRRLGAGAFTAVSRGSARRDAALVHIAYRPRAARGAARPIALVGKGLCFDTGGLNLKSPRAMLDMHTDMAGSAVALGLLDALSAAGYPRAVDAWLALAENRIGPDSYTQQDVVTAANGTTIQVTHTDAEGRMVLADTLALASRTRPACLLDFATLTGACVGALTERLSGAFTNRPALREPIEAAGARSGERVWTLPMPADFDEELDSPVADIAQCLQEGKGDHIYAARFLSRFVGADIPWIHVDLSSAQRHGGLGHVPAAITGFGVRFGAALLGDTAFLRAIGAAR